ncbi:hypothetical protein LCGC14_1889820 [marine sediment metagenome]|uniref:Uncharacterized protein n=1 Tax=marine sediment metagenome TaxID=412755 RepID=A0A0F9GMZ9_9ZZZZ
MERLDSDIEITQKQIDEALCPPADFGYSGDNPDMFDTWSAGPCIRTRDSGLLAKSNADSLIAHLESDPSLSDDWELVTFNHWACGWTDQVSFRTVDGHGKASRIFRVLMAWQAALDDYPVADEADWSRREHEGQVEYIRDNTPDVDIDKAPDNWPEMVFSYLWDANHYFQDTDDGGWIEDERLLEAIRALGWSEPVEI